MNPNKNPLIIKNVNCCIYCNYESSNKKDYKKHLLTEKHKKLIDPNKNPKTDSLICECGKKYKHLSSLCNHKKNCYIYIEKNTNKNPQTESLICNCGKKYKHLSSLCNHKKNCTFLKETTQITNTNNSNDSNDSIEKLTNLVVEVVKQNQDFKDLIIEQNKIIIDLTKNSGNNNNNITTNSNNKTFNLQVILNEKCKDALNINEFVNSLKLTLEDLENVGESGFVNGITRIFVNGLKQLDVCKRPIHCIDLKR